MLKADIEGAELGLLRGGMGVLSSGRVKHVLIEEHDEWLVKAGGSIDALRALLKSARFSIVETLPDDMVLWSHQPG